MSDRVVTAKPDPGIDPVWRSMPPESTAAFRDSFSQIARAIQLALREYLPARWFAEASHYYDLERSFPMLAYQASRPAAFRQGRDYTYDLLSEASAGSLFRSIRLRLPKELQRIEASGVLDGAPDLAAKYAPRRAQSIAGFVSRHRRALNRILATETRLVNALVLFAVALPKGRSTNRAADRFAQSWRGSLARIYPDVDASEFFDELLRRATAALIQSQIERMNSEFSADAPTTSA